MKNETCIIAYHSEAKEVMWWVEGEGLDYLQNQDNPVMSLYTHMQNLICKGQTFEILEFWPRGFPEQEEEDIGVNGPDLAQRCCWWDEQLRNLGYDICTPASKEQDDG